MPPRVNDKSYFVDVIGNDLFPKESNIEHLMVSGDDTGLTLWFDKKNKFYLPLKTELKLLKMMVEHMKKTTGL